MKRITAIFMALLLAASILSAAPANAVDNQLTVFADGENARIYQVGDEIAYYLYFDLGDTVIINSDVRITYDPEKLEIVEHKATINGLDPTDENPESMEAYSFPKKIYASALLNVSKSGLIRFNFSQAGGIGTLTGDHTLLARFHFRVKEAGSTDIASQIYTMCDYSGSYIYFKGTLQQGYHPVITGNTLYAGASAGSYDVAEVNGNYYETFADAALERVSNNNVITLLANIAEPYSLSEKEKLKVAKGSFTLTVTAPTGYTVITFSEEEGAVTVYQAMKLSDVVCSASLALKDSININFYVKSIPASTKRSDYTVTYQFLGHDENETTVTLPAESTTAIVVAECAAKEMTDMVSIVVKYKGNQIKSYYYSVETYCLAMINANNASDALKDLCRATLDYGYTAQENFNYRTDSKPNNNTLYNNISGIVIGEENNKYSSEGTCSSVKSISATLVLKSKTMLNFYITPASGVNASSLTVSVKDKNNTDITGSCINETLTDGRRHICITGIAAKDLDDVYTLTVSDGSSARTITYSPLTYTFFNQNSEEKLANCVKALYNYSVTANESLS